MSTITLHGFAPSTFVRTARMAAHELGIDCALKPLDFRSESHRTLHPFLRMPVLTDGDTTVFETLAIVAYFDDKAGGGRLLATSGSDRWRQLGAISILLDYAYQPVVHGEDADAAQAAKQVYDWAEGYLTASSYLAGAELSAADLILAPMIAHRLSQPEAGETLTPYPALSEWFAAISDRASFRETAA